MDAMRNYRAGRGWGRRKAVWSTGVLWIIVAVAACAPDETFSPVDPTAELAEAEALSNTGGRWRDRALRIDPDSTAVLEPGDTVRLSVMQLSALSLNAAGTAVEASWAIMHPEVVTIVGRSAEQRTVLVRALKPGRARILAIEKGRVAIARLWVGEADAGEDPGEDPAEGPVGEDPAGEDPVGVAATVPSPAPNLLAGDTITLRPALIDEDSVVIPTEPSEWSAEVDAGVLTVSTDFLVTALASTPVGATTTLVLRHIETGVAVNVDIVVLPESDPADNDPPDHVPGQWPNNEPAGMQPILSANGSSQYWPGWGWGGAWNDGNRVRVVKDANSKSGHAIEKRFLVGDTDGWNGLTYRRNWGLYRQQYTRMVFQFSPNFQFHRGHQKLIYWGGGQRRGKGPVMFIMFVVNGGQIEFRNSSGFGAAEDRGSFRSGRRIEPGKYHTLEVLHTANDPGKSDGALRAWLDGVEITDWRHNGAPAKLTNRNWMGTSEVPNGDTRLTGMQAMLYWGGQGDTKTVNDWMRISEFYISGKN